MENENKELLWQLFKTTGNISYYLLYKRIDSQYDTNQYT